MSFLHKYIVSDHPQYGVWLETTTTDEFINSLDMADTEWQYKPISSDKWVKFTVERVTDHSRITIGHFFFQGMPGNCEVVCCFGVELTKNTRHSGLSTPFRKAREDLARMFGHRLMIATVDMSNYPALGSFMKIYKLVATWVSNYSKHPISFGIKEL